MWLCLFQLDAASFDTPALSFQTKRSRDEILDDLKRIMKLKPKARLGVSRADRFFFERVYLRNWKDSAGVMQLASLVADKNATDNTGWLPWFLIDKGYSVFPRWARDGRPNIYSNVWQNHSTNTFAASMCNGIGLGNDMWVKLVHSSEMSGLNTNWFCSWVKIQKTRWSNFPFHRFTVLLTWGSCRDSNCSNCLYCADGASVQDGFKSEVLAEFHFQNFMSRADSFNWAEALQGSPALSLLYTVYTVYVNLCMYDVYVWRLFRRSDRHPQGFARNKASAQRRRGSDSQHCWTGLDSLWYFGHFWVLGLGELYLT